MKKTGIKPNRTIKAMAETKWWMNMDANRMNKGLLLLCAFVFRYMLDVFYGLFCKQYAYFGLSYAPQSNVHFFLSYVVMLLPFVVFNSSRFSASGVLLCCLLFFQWVPCATLFANDVSSSAIAFYGLGGVYAVIAWLNRRSIVLQSTFANGISARHYIRLLWALSLLLLIPLLLHYGAQFKWHSVDDLYVARDEYKNQTGRMLTYVFNWLAYVVNPLLFIYALNTRRYFSIALSIAVQVYLFGLGAHKAVLLLFPFMALVFLVVKSGKWVSYTGIAAGLCCLVTYFLYHDHFNTPVSLPSSVVFWRGFVMPAQLYFDYYDFSVNNQLDWLAQSFPFDQFSQTIYDKKIPYIIGDKYLISGRGINANANFWADLFVNTGYWTFIIGLVFLVVFLKVIDLVAYRKHAPSIIAVVSTTLIGLLNGPFIANFITQGFVLLVILLFLFPADLKSKTSANELAGSE